VILSKCDEVSQADRQSWKTEAVQQGFVEFVEKGGGLLIIHTGTVPDKNAGTFEKLMGCRFKGHPNACPVTVQPIKPHPVTEGVEMFCEVDEHYQLDIIAPDADVIIASYSPQQGEEGKRQEDPYHNTVAAIQPAGYVRSQGKGRVCVLTPGHNLPVWHNPQFQRTLSNALRWCGRE
jgi:type 1 glutamine amidotransferase